MTGAHVSLSDTGLARVERGPVCVTLVTESVSAVLGWPGPGGLCRLRDGWSPRGHCRGCQPSSCSV